MKPCKHCGGTRTPRKADPRKYQCATCDKRGARARCAARRLKKLRSTTPTKWPYGIGAEVARQLGIRQTTVSAVMVGKSTSARVTAALIAERNRWWLEVYGTEYVSVSPTPLPSQFVSLTIGSLFSGIGGLELGLERAGLGPTLWQVEQSPFCRAVLAKHWPDATRYEDVRNVGSRNLAAVDVICGGFPCQDVSSAGRRAGVVIGSRSGLWFEYARIIRELRPRYVVVENVSALLTIGLDAVLGELAESGYDAEWDCLPASALGAPHRRDRVFVLAYPHGERIPRHSESENIGTTRIARPWRWREDRTAFVRSVSNSPFERGESWPQPLLRGVDDGVPNWAHRLKALGNAVVPQVAEVVGRVIMQMEAVSVSPHPNRVSL